jgi:hypothetical protein
MICMNTSISMHKRTVKEDCNTRTKWSVWEHIVLMQKTDQYLKNSQKLG